MASSNPFRVGSRGWGTLIHQNHAAGEENGSIMVGMFVCLCLASKMPSKREFFVPAKTDLGVKLLGDDYATRMKLYNLVFRMVFLLYGIKIKWPLKEVVGWWMAETATIASHIGPGLKSQPGCNLFLLICVRIHTNEFIQLLYKLYSMNSYTVWFLYQFIHFLYKLYSTNSYKV
jgi:hypothetical protein